MTKIKICGLTSEEPARVAAAAGADFVGVIFAPSRRQVDEKTAKRIIKAARKTRKDIQAVGVFVNETEEHIASLADKAGLDWVQLSGDEPAAFGRELGRPVLKVVHVGQEKAVTLCRRLDKIEKELGGRQHLFLLDTRAPGRYGGTGKPFDWEAARVAAERFPLVLAGGLTPDNVTEALASLHPWGVDVSSGVETDGAKDPDKIRKFIEKVRDHDA